MNKPLNKIIDETFDAARETVSASLNNATFTASIEQAAGLMFKTSNRIIVTGMGKSGLIGRKVAATLTSTGTPAVYLHPADALHGDMGNVGNGEVVLAFSNSGETRELIELLPHLKLLNANLVAVTGRKDSTLAKESDCSIIYTMPREGCPLELAPMASTTISLIIGDALAAALIHLKDFKAADFSRFHPSGSLGKRLLTRVQDVMHTAKDATVIESMPFKQLLSVMVSSNLGAILVTSNEELTGIITDGDIKRYLDKLEQSPGHIYQKQASEIMTKNPVATTPETLVQDALKMMYSKKTYTLPVVDPGGAPAGLVRMHDLIEYT